MIKPHIKVSQTVLEGTCGEGLSHSLQLVTLGSHRLNQRTQVYIYPINLTWSTKEGLCITMHSNVSCFLGTSINCQLLWSISIITKNSLTASTHISCWSWSHVLFIRSCIIMCVCRNRSLVGRTHHHWRVWHSPGGQRATSAAPSQSPHRSSSDGRKGARGSEGTGWHTSGRVNFLPWRLYLEK